MNTSFRSVIVGLAALSTAEAGDLSGYIRLDNYRFCPIERYEQALETACHWDASARAAGNCDQPQYQQVVGRRPIYQACQTLLLLGDGGPMPANPYPGVSSTDAKIWRLMKALQPITLQAVKLNPPACMSKIKPYPERRAKADHEFFFSCLDESDIAIRKQVVESAAGRIVSTVETALLRADFNNPQTVAASNELALLLEDEGATASLQSVKDISARFK
jgi:hypothetical protein